MDTLPDLSCTTIEGRSSNFSECSSLSSVSDHDIEFTKTDNGRSTSRKWKKLMKKLVQRSKTSFYGSSKPVVYGYDAVSYSLNFDDGNHGDEYYLYGARCSQALSNIPTFSLAGVASDLSLGKHIPKRHVAGKV
ncbi:hypothetical protein Tco_0356755 [Tanacetum coccineum]